MSIILKYALLWESTQSKLSDGTTFSTGDGVLLAYRLREIKQKQ